jgi:hypothetical protein
VIAFPSLVLVALDRGTKVDPSKVHIQMAPPDQGDTDQPLQILK